MNAAPQPSRSGRRLRWAIPLALLVAVTVVTVVVPGLRRRATLVALFATGRLPDLALEDVLRMLPPRGPQDVASLVQSGNPYATFSNPHETAEDVKAGEERFRAECALCHETHAGVGPDLSRGEFRRGASDWALYRTIRYGVPGTVMAPHPLPHRSLWQLVAYIRSLAATTSRDTSGLAVPAVTYSMLRDARNDPASWLTYSGTYDGQRRSTLTEINTGTVSRLGIRWIYQFPGPETSIETTPLVVGTTLFVTSPPGEVIALDALTGTSRWHYTRPAPEGLQLCCGRQNRGVAIEGTTLYLGTIDAHLVALDARTGKPLWEVEVADHRDGYSITGAPLAADGRVIVGVGGGEFGIRGFLDAYDAATGQRLWRTYTVPGPGEPGHDTWAGDSWKTGGAPTWMTGTLDPETRTIYWPVGNPGPDYNGDVRLGDNLYSNSVLALDLDTGRIKWHFQFTHHDEHDWDATEIPVLAEGVIDGASRRLLLQANRNGFYYVLDRETGKFLAGRAFVHQTWASGLDADGRAQVLPGSSPTLEGTLTWPGVGGATNWWSPSYDPATGLFYVAATEGPGIFTKSADVPARGPGGFVGSAGRRLPTDPVAPVVRALVATTGEARWEYLPPPTPEGLHGMGGLLSTAGGVLFGGSETLFFALDSRTGAELWRMRVGGFVRAAPVTYLAGGEQLVTVAAGRSIFTFGLPGESR